MSINSSHIDVNAASVVEDPRRVPQRATAASLFSDFFAGGVDATTAATATDFVLAGADDDDVAATG